DKIKENEKWLKELQVSEVNRIKTTYILAPINEQVVDDNTSSCILQQPGNKWTLYIRKSVDYYSIAKSISQIAYKKVEFRLIASVDVILSKSLDALREMGLPVKRLFEQEKKNKYFYENEEFSVKDEVLKNILNHGINLCSSSSKSGFDGEGGTNIVTEGRTSYCDEMPGKNSFIKIHPYIFI